jgi:hypothetical protein
MIAETNSYRQIRQLVRDGDQFLARNGGVIGSEAPSGHSHSGVVFWSRGTLTAFESREFIGAHSVSLSSLVRKYPGRIDLFRPNCIAAVASVAADWAVRMAGHDYGYRNVLAASLRHGFVARRAVRFAMQRLGYQPPNLTDVSLSDFHEPKFCAQANVWLYRTAQLEVCRELGNLAPDDWDPWPGINERYVEPWMLSGGSFRCYARGLRHS